MGVGGADGADVELFAPGQRHGCPVEFEAFDFDVGGGVGGVDGVGEEFGGAPGRGGVYRAVGAVEADHGVQVDDAPALEFGDFGVGEPGVIREVADGEPGGAGEATS